MTMMCIFLVTEPPAIPPKFTVQLVPRTATDGEEVVLTCKVTGRPMPELSWFHNDKCIDACEDFVINYNRQTGQCDCVIVECLPDDHGMFKCVAKNSGGQAITTGMLAVRSKEGIMVDQIKPQQSQRVRAGPPQRPPQGKNSAISTFSTSVNFFDRLCFRTCLFFAF